MGAENRLSTEQLAALSPGDTVTIESGADFSRRRYTTGTVTRIDAAHLFVRSSGPRGSSYVERYRRRDGVRVTGGAGAELVNPEAAEAGTTGQRREAQRINELFWAWRRRPGDVEALRQLHAAIGILLEESFV